jgi:DNA-binding PadR family transcriptional regulator
MKTYNYPVNMLSPIEAAILALLRGGGMQTLHLLEELGVLIEARKIHHQSLYVFLQRLRDEGLVHTDPEPPAQPRTHTLTDLGAERLSWCLGWWEALSDECVTSTHTHR